MKVDRKLMEVRKLLRKEVASLLSKEFHSIKEGEESSVEPLKKLVPGQYRVFHTYNERGDLKHRSTVVKASSAPIAEQKVLNYLRSIAAIKGNTIEARSIRITGVEPAEVVSEDQQSTMDFAGNEVQTLFDKFRKLPAAHLRKKVLDSRACKRLRLPQGCTMYTYTWGANSASAFGVGDTMYAMLAPNDRAHDLFTELERLLKVKDFVGQLTTLALKTATVGYDDLFYFDTVAGAFTESTNTPAPVQKKAAPTQAPTPPTPKVDPKVKVPVRPEPKVKVEPEKPDQEDDNGDKGAEITSMVNSLVQKIKHTIGEPESDDITEALTTLLQAWGFTSEQKLMILKTVRNNTIR